MTRHNRQEVVNKLSAVLCSQQVCRRLPCLRVGAQVRDYNKLVPDFFARAPWGHVAVSTRHEVGDTLMYAVLGIPAREVFYSAMAIDKAALLALRVLGLGVPTPLGHVYFEK